MYYGDVHCTLPPPQIPIPLEDFSIQVHRQSLLVTIQIPQGLVHGVDLCGTVTVHHEYQRYI